tara:strand:- start:5179 stop:5385 length:207 start_codon:yes stop_codon:yes gene_type:complete
MTDKFRICPYGDDMWKVQRKWLIWWDVQDSYNTRPLVFYRRSDATEYIERQVETKRRRVEIKPERYPR